MKSIRTNRLTALVVVILLATEGCYTPWPGRESEAGGTKTIYFANMWQLPDTAVDEIKKEQKEMIAACEVVFDWLHKEKDQANKKEAVLEGSEIALATAIVLLTIANPAANAAVISALGALGGLSWFSLRPFMTDVNATENELVEALKKIHEEYKKAVAANNMSEARTQIGKAMAICVLGKETISPIPDKPVPKPSVPTP